MLFAAFLFSFRLNTLPTTYVDEAVVGYNSYALLKTGKDQYGQTFPLYIRYFGAYTPAGYAYLSLLPVKLFGLSNFSIRLFSVIAGIGMVYLVYLFTNSYWAAIFFAILPWTLFNSRLGYEVMTAAFIFNLGAYFIYRSLPRISYQGLLFISLSTYFAHTQKYLTPLFLLGYFIYIRRLDLKSFLILLITQIPNLFFIFTPAFWIKGSALSLKFFLMQIITYLSPQSLFWRLPDIDLQHQIPNISIFFWWMIIPLFIGLSQIKKIKNYQFLIFWILISIVPAALTGEFISIQRALPLLLPLYLIIWQGLKNKSSLLLLLLFGYSFWLTFRSYFLFLPRFNSLSWNYGYQEFSNFAANHPQNTFLIDNTRNPRNYILPLYYLSFDPNVYQQLVDPSILKKYYHPNFSYPDIYHYSNLTFKSLNWHEVGDYDYIVSDGLSVSTSQASDHSLKLEKIIRTPNNQTALEIYQVIK